MIKRIAILSLMLVYLSTTAGFALTLHFCGSKVSNIGINRSSPKPCCPTESASKPDSCCKDQHLKIKVSDKQHSIQSAKIPAASNLDLFVIPERIQTFSTEIARLSSQLRHRGPPSLPIIPLTIQNCVFRI
jgi:hypothetical protein